MQSDYRLAPAIAVRLMGVALVVIAVLVLLATALVLLLDVGTWLLVVPVVLGLVFFLVAGTLWARRGWVFRATDDGYRVQWVRGVGTESARWADVEDAVTATVAGAPVVQLRLRDGRTSTIPVQMLATDREQFVRELQQRLHHGTR
ncbi:MAG: hypothetical protein ACI379_00080 [Nocardioides sp.]|uniref:hypothetical protein n=1 Tax=Nocardioides sp. TaxID=35761 RepID=UPI003F0BCFD7